MKILKLLIVVSIAIAMACTDLNLNPLSEGSSENWYSNETEITMALNDLYKEVFWTVDDDEWTDDFTRRNMTNPINTATITGEWATLMNYWINSYKAIVRANTILMNLEKSKGTIPQVKLDKYAGNAYFVRACQYSNLISHFGDVVYYSEVLDLNESFSLSKTSKATILQSIFKDFDDAAAKLPITYGSSENKLATKGAAFAMKARIALYMGDWVTARDAAKACIDLNAYELYSDFQTLHLSKTKNPKELIFGIPRSTELGQSVDIKGWLPRNNGGWGAREAPSWELLCSFLCTDGLTIDKSSLFNPREPFKNRDPRCTLTIVEFQTPFLGFMYQPHPDSLQVMNFNTGKKQTNNDTRSNQAFASFSGLARKKSIDLEWADDLRSENDIMIIRYADVLLMYAEAKIELNEIDQSVRDAINMVRARAYKVNYNASSSYPQVVSNNQAELRRIVRIERRMEFAFEGLRYMDIIRWKIADKVLNRPIFGLLDPVDLRIKVVNPGLWFFPQIPQIDESGSPDLTPIYSAGLCKILVERRFDSSKQYLWPIPTKEILINPNILQNPGY